MRLLILDLELVIAMFGLIVVKVDVGRFRLGGHSFILYVYQKIICGWIDKTDMR